MIVECPKCQRRYQLPDDKIKPPGVRVTCRNCQNKFNVMSTSKPIVSQAPAPSHSHSSPAPDTSTLSHVSMLSADHVPTLNESEFSARGLIEVSFNPATEVRIVQARKARRVLEDPSFPQEIPVNFPAAHPSSGTLPLLSPSAAVKKTMPTLQPPEGKAIAPQRETALSVKTQWQRPSFIAITALASIGLVYGSLHFFMSSPESATAPISTSLPAPSPSLATSLHQTTIDYREDPKVTALVINTANTLPAEKREAASQQGLMAFASISHGLLTGDANQVSQGLMQASRLLLTKPHGLEGLRPLLAHAEWMRDLNAIRDIHSQWPEESMKDPEYILASLMLQTQDPGSESTSAVNLKADQIAVIAKKAQNLLSEVPTFHRALIWTLSLYLSVPPESQKTFDKMGVDKLMTAYKKFRSQITASPPLIHSVDERLKTLQP